MYKKKSLGQNFLQSPRALRSMVDAALLTKDSVVLEVGPGEGALTRGLLESAGTVVAVEKDARLIPILTARFDAEIATKKLILIEADILEFDIGAFTATYTPAGAYTLAANIPYYITGAIIRQFLSAEAQPTTAALLMQKEVAERIARSAKESLLSLAVKAYGTPKYIETVPAGAFSPVPSVDSAILQIKGISRSNFIDSAHEERFFALLHAGFAQKRKLLRRNIETVLGEKALSAMQNADIPENARAEDVPLEKWLLLAR